MKKRECREKDGNQIKTVKTADGAHPHRLSSRWKSRLNLEIFSVPRTSLRCSPPNGGQLEPSRLSINENFVQRRVVLERFFADRELDGGDDDKNRCGLETGRSDSPRSHVPQVEERGEKESDENERGKNDETPQKRTKWGKGVDDVAHARQSKNSKLVSTG